MIVILSFMLLFAHAIAHDFWIGRDGSGFRIYYGHFPKELIHYDPEKLTNVKCYDKDLKEISFQKVVDSKGVLIKGECAVITAEYRAGFFSVTPDGEVNKPKDRVENAVKSWESISYIKYIDEYSEKLKRPLGQRLEVVSLNDPFKKKPGEKINIQVFFEGKPKEGVFIYTNHRLLGKTRDEGLTRVRIRKGSVQVISASYKIPTSSPKADYIVLESFLCFEVKR